MKIYQEIIRRDKVIHINTIEEVTTPFGGERNLTRKQLLDAIREAASLDERIVEVINLDFDADSTEGILIVNLNIRIDTEIKDQEDVVPISLIFERT